MGTIRIKTGHEGHSGTDGFLSAKVVLDTCNPNPGRDGDMAVAARAKETGVASAEFLPGVRLVRALNTVGYGALRSGAHRAGDKVAIPLAAADEAALKIAIQLGQDAGFEPVVVGPLARAKEFDTGTPVMERRSRQPNCAEALEWFPEGISRAD